MNTLLTVALILASLSLYAFIKKPHFNTFVYHPAQDISNTPEDFGYKYKEDFIKTKDGEKIYFWKISPNTKIKATIIQVHGNAHNMSSHFTLMFWFLEQGYEVIAFDYRGYGKSTGSPSRVGVVDDTVAIINMTCQSSPKPVFAIGQSLGGAVLVPALEKSPQSCVDKVIIEASFSSYQSVVEEIFSFFYLGSFLSLLISDEMSPRNFMKKPKPPALFLHTESDEVVPYSEGKKFFSLYNSKQKKFITLIKGRHLGALPPKASLAQELVGFLQDSKQK
jgi:uncharacterized protein